MISWIYDSKMHNTHLKLILCDIPTFARLALLLEITSFSTCVELEKMYKCKILQSGLFLNEISESYMNH